MLFRAVCFDLGGVVFDSPFAALAELEQQRGIEPGAVNAAIVAAGSDGAWARHERGEIDRSMFLDQLDDELNGLAVGASEVMDSLDSLRLRPAMLDAVDRLRAAQIKTAAVTNNWIVDDRPSAADFVADRFDTVVESVRVGVHKPDPRIYRIALERLGVDAGETIFLDDVGRNLKTARDLGMTTIKVVDPTEALETLGVMVGLALV